MTRAVRDRAGCLLAGSASVRGWRLLTVLAALPAHRALLMRDVGVPQKYREKRQSEKREMLDSQSKCARRIRSSMKSTECHGQHKQRWRLWSSLPATNFSDCYRDASDDGGKLHSRLNASLRG